MTSEAWLKASEAQLEAWLDTSEAWFEASESWLEASEGWFEASNSWLEASESWLEASEPQPRMGNVWMFVRTYRQTDAQNFPYCTGLAFVPPSGAAAQKEGI